MSRRRAGPWHGLTAAVSIGALALQLVLVISGSAVLAEVDPPGLGLRLARYAAYFTIQSNLLVAITALQLARNPRRDGEWWRVLRVVAVVGIGVTGIVHFFLLRPLLELNGWDYAADKALHMVVPVLAVVGWLVFGPRPRVTIRAVALALAWPLAWLVLTLVVGGLSGWFPYPFLDFDENGAGEVIVACVGVTLVFLAGFGAALVADRRVPAAPAPTDRVRQAPG